MRFVPHDIGTYFVRASRRQIYHLVDLIDCQCSCESFEFTGHCRHLRVGYRRRAAGKLPMIVGMSGRG